MHRTPVEKILKNILSVVSLGKFDKVYEDYDDIYHLFMIVRLFKKDTKQQVFLQTEKRPNIVVKEVKNLDSSDNKLDDFKKYYVFYNKNPEYNEYKSHFENIKNNLNLHSCKIF